MCILFVLYYMLWFWNKYKLKNQRRKNVRKEIVKKELDKTEMELREYKGNLMKFCLFGVLTYWKFEKICKAYNCIEPKIQFWQILPFKT